MKERYLDIMLKEYAASDMYPFHMPGHKRQPMDLGEGERLDITEIHGFDNLHYAQGILREAQERTARMARADASFYLVNGSTSGILAAVSAQTKRGGRILAARNCHKAVYHSIFLQELKARYLYPMSTEFGIQGSISPEEVEKKLEEYPDAETVLITSPTYDGVVSDIRAISRAVHARDKVLIVDGAHGAHFGFSKGFPQAALEMGADIVIESLHKTLPSFTQTAVLHIKGERVNTEELRRYLGIFQTSSPSYLFMAGMDRCSRVLEKRGGELFERFEERLDRFYDRAKNLKCLYVLDRAGEERDPGIYMRDKSKILISGSQAGISGQELMDILRRDYHLELEMASGHYATALTSICDTEEGFRRLIRALEDLDGKLSSRSRVQRNHGVSDSRLYSPVRRRMELRDAALAEKETVRLADSAGMVSGEFLYLYPPGIPFIVPGEEIPQELPEQIFRLKRLGYDIQGPEDYTLEGIKVVL